MNKLTQTLILLIIATVFSSCASKVKLQNSYKSDEFDAVKNEKVLVFNKSKREGIRQRGEREIANQLRAEGIDAVEAFEAFPSVKNRNDRTEAELAQVLKTLVDAGYGAIVLTKLKNPEDAKTTTTRLTDQDKTDETAKYYDTSDYGKYPVSFGVYFNNPAGSAPAPNRTPGPSGLEETRDHYSEQYELETVTYSITPEYERLVGSVSIKISDPDNIMDIISKYATLVAKQFK